MWVSRDKDGSLYLYEDKPVKGSRMFERDKTITFRHSDVAVVYGDFSPFSEVTWENSPIELIIKTKENDEERIRKAILELVKQSSETLDKQNQEQMIAWLKKQGEQKSFDYENANIQQRDFAPKAEPKFHKDDWVVFTAGECSTS